MPSSCKRRQVSQSTKDVRLPHVLRRFHGKGVVQLNVLDRCHAEVGETGFHVFSQQVRPVEGVPDLDRAEDERSRNVRQHSLETRTTTRRHDVEGQRITLLCMMAGASGRAGTH